MPLTAIIDATTKAVAADTANAAVSFRVTGTSAGTMATVVQARQHSWTIDEPPTLGGQDAAANPIEFALAALASCHVVTYRFWAARLGIALDEITVDAEGDLDVRGFFGLDTSVRPGFTAVRVSVNLSGPETAERYQQLREVVDTHCPVLDLFGNPTPVDSEVLVRAAA
jgi:uncharacterized OsmC-like protein